MYKKYYQEFLKAHKGIVHFASHSHHFWPDKAKEGHLKAYDKAVKLSDKKWEDAFTCLIPKIQRLIANHLQFSRPKDIAFAPNTHDLIVKLISPCLNKQPFRILSSTEEFHSLSRQLRRFNEEDNIVVDYIDPHHNDFQSQIIDRLHHQSYDYIFMSHVFFTSGKVLSNNLIQTILEHKNQAIFILDGYHHYAAIPFNLGPFEDQLYYLGGGYKYAQAGEGICFMTLPKKCSVRPLITGWFAGFNELQTLKEDVHFEDSGMRFWGSTIDFTAFYRFQAVWSFFEQENLSIRDFHQYVRELQKELIQDNPYFDYLTENELSSLGHFLSLDCGQQENANTIFTFLRKRNIVTDFRGRYLRIGLAPYQTKQDVQLLKKALKDFKSQENR